MTLNSIPIFEKKLGMSEILHEHSFDIKTILFGWVTINDNFRFIFLFLRGISTRNEKYRYTDNIKFR